MAFIPHPHSYNFKHDPPESGEGTVWLVFVIALAIVIGGMIYIASHTPDNLSEMYQSPEIVDR